MANTIFNDRIVMSGADWAPAQSLRLPVATPSTSTTFVAAIALLRNSLGNLVMCDDTSKGEFVGFAGKITQSVADSTTLVQSNGLLGDLLIDVYQPPLYTALIAAAAPGDEGRKVYWLFNNQVSYTPGANANYAGTVYWVKDATHVFVKGPWFNRTIGQGSKAVNRALPTTASVTLTKWDVGSSLQLVSTIAQTIILPPVAGTSPGDFIKFFYNSASAIQQTLQGSGTDNINGANTNTSLGTARYSKIEVESDGTQWFVG